MYKIALLGIENSHADAFVEFVNSGFYPDIEIVGAYSDEKEALDNFTEKYNVKAMSSYDELVGKVDGIMITARHGKNHFLYAKPYMQSGIPMFIDKPITCSVEDAEQMVKMAKENGVRFCGGSTCGFVKEVNDMQKIVSEEKNGRCIGGSIIVPLCFRDQYGGFFFYAQHLVQVLINVFGGEVEEVYAVKGKNYNYTVMFKYKNFVISGNFADTDDTKMYYFHITAYGTKNAESTCFDVVKDDFHHEMKDMLDLLNGKDQKQSYEDFILPVYVMNSIIKSVETGNWVRVKE